MRQFAGVSEQYMCRSPTLLFQVVPEESAEDEPPFGTDCYPFDVPIELAYSSETTSAPLYHMPPPTDAIVSLLFAAIALSEVRDCVEDHSDPRGLLFFDRGVTDGISDGPLDYARATERLAGAGFWVPKPTSATQLVTEIHACLSPEAAARAAAARAHYPVQYATDQRWLDGLWRFVVEYIRQRERLRTAV